MSFWSEEEEPVEDHKEEPVLPWMSIHSHVQSLGQLTIQLLKEWTEVILPTLSGMRQFTFDHVTYCKRFRSFINTMAQLNMADTQSPRSLPIQAALAPYHGIKNLLIQRRVQIRLPNFCTAVYRDLKYSNPGKRGHTGKVTTITTKKYRSKSGAPLNSSDFDMLNSTCVRGSKRCREEEEEEENEEEDEKSDE